ncbi:MAG TPA: mevalonate kinase [Aggregatilineales bacterium]|nr:mevalonate kinase [Aggregatilineales bacterium]
MHTAPAKIILFGEHAVVYGQPAIAVPFTALNATADSTPAPHGSGLTIYAPDIQRTIVVTKNKVEDVGDVLAYAAQRALVSLDVPMPDLTLTVRSTIPLASGLGSGAAICTALIRELTAAIGRPLEGDALNALVFETEKIFHGTPSGIDNTVIVMGKPVYFVRGTPPETFHIQSALTFVIADSGIAAPTRESVGDVRKLYEANPALYQTYFDHIGAIARTARTQIERGDVPGIGRLMNENHDLLGTLTVSSPRIDDLVAAARGAGALGAKVSGGGRGGNMIALAEPSRAESVLTAVKAAGAVRGWITTLAAN